MQQYVHRFCGNLCCKASFRGNRVSVLIITKQTLFIIKLNIERDQLIMIESATKNAFDSVSGLWDKIYENVDVLDEVEDDEKIFKNELVIEADKNKK